MAKKKAVKKAIPISVPAMSFSDMLGDLANRAAAEKAKFDALTPKQRKAYIAKKAKEEQEIQEILRELGPGGPTRLQVGF
jgi:hypothetical protein